MDKVLKIAEQEVGYLEKKNNAQLDSKTGNAGSNNYTKYWRDMKAAQGQPWCLCFCVWCYYTAYGEKRAKELLCMDKGWTYYTPTSAQYFKNKKQWFSKPQVGDIIYFKNSTRICHVGIVYKVDASKVYTIEGNTSGAAGVVANGGGVFKKSYTLNNSRIAGYGRPNYLNQVVQKELPTLRKGDKGEYVTAWQNMLSIQGFYKGKVDGVFSDELEKAVKAYQKAHKLTADGIIGIKTWATV